MPAYQITITTPGLAQAAQQMRSAAQAAQQMRPPAGSMQRLQAAHAQFLRAQAGPNAAVQFDAQVALRRAQMRFQRDQQLLTGGGPRFADRLNTFIRSTRFGAGGASPLVGRAMDLAGAGGSPGATAGIAALVAALVAASAGVRAFAAAVKAGAEAARAAAEARTLSGGTAAQIAGIQAMGIPAEQIAGIAARLRSALAGGGMAGAYGSQAGLGVTLGRDFGGTNEASILQKAIEGISGLATAEDRLRVARGLELDALLPQIEALRRNRAAIMADAKAREAIADPGMLQAADDLFNAVERIKFNFLSVAQALGKPLLADITAGINIFATGLRELAEWLNAHPDVFRDMIRPFLVLIELTGRFAEAMGVLKTGTVDAIIRDFQAEKKRQDKHANALDKHAAALNRHAIALGNGLYGGGQRAAAALPGKFNGFAFDQAVVGGSLRMGAFAI